MPGYGIQPAGDGTGLLPWGWAVERLLRSHDYWIATVWPDGRPHVTPVWGVWMQDAVWFSCSPNGRKARNLASDARCTATTDNAYEPVIVEGRAELDASAVQPFTDTANAKYETDMPVSFFEENHLYRLAPEKVIALTEADFTGSPTRWRFNRS